MSPPIPDPTFTAEQAIIMGHNMTLDALSQGTITMDPEMEVRFREVMSMLPPYGLGSPNPTVTPNMVANMVSNLEQASPISLPSTSQYNTPNQFPQPQFSPPTHSQTPMEPNRLQTPNLMTPRDTQV